LIWNRAIASQMESAELERTTVDIVAKAGSRNIELRASGQVVKFDGFLTLYQEGQDETPDDDESRRLPAMSEGETLSKQAIESSQHFTEPPPRFSEAALVKRMEELGIGRPSTYASILQVLQDRGYVRIDKKRLIPEDKGRVVVAFLESFFTRYVEYDFTAGLEEKLDEISAGPDRLACGSRRVLGTVRRRRQRHQGSAQSRRARRAQRFARAAHFP
jgi:DNA topoisomerase-1